MMDNGTGAQRQTERQARLFLVYVKHEKKRFLFKFFPFVGKCRQGHDEANEAERAERHV